MKSDIQQIQQWLAAGESVAVATVVQVSGSVPRPLGAKLLVTAAGDFAGSVSGGCVENAVIETASQVLQSGQPQRLHFGITSEMGWEVGLACGGQIDVWVQPAVAEIWARVERQMQSHTPSALLTVISENSVAGQQAVFTPDAPLFPAEWNFPELIPAVEKLLSQPDAAPTVQRLPDGTQILIEPLLPPPLLLIIGGVHAAVPLTKLAQMLDYRVIVADPRRRFANPDRFPTADAIVVAWPNPALEQISVDQRTAIVILTHDPKIDDPALLGALASDAFYIGAIGSRRTHRERLQRLHDQGFTAAQLGRLYGPIGLNLGGQSPEALALSIMAEITAVRHGRDGGFLRDR